MFKLGQFIKLFLVSVNLVNHFDSRYHLDRRHWIVLKMCGEDSREVIIKFILLLMLCNVVLWNEKKKIGVQKCYIEHICDGCLNLFSLPIKFRKKWIALIDNFFLKCLLKFLYIEQDITTLRLVLLTNHKIYNATIKICIQVKCVQCSDFITSGTFHW